MIGERNHHILFQKHRTDALGDGLGGLLFVHAANIHTGNLNTAENQVVIGIGKMPIGKKTTCSQCSSGCDPNQRKNDFLAVVSPEGRGLFVSGRGALLLFYSLLESLFNGLLLGGNMFGWDGGEKLIIFLVCILL